MRKSWYLSQEEFTNLGFMSKETKDMGISLHHTERVALHYCILTVFAFVFVIGC